MCLRYRLSFRSFTLLFSVDNLERALSVCNLGKPYQWTQWLAGLDYLSSSASSSSLPTSQQPCADLSRRHFERTFRLIVDRLSTRVALSQQLAQLAEGQIVVDGANRFPQKVSSVLQRFVKITAEEAIVRYFGLNRSCICFCPKEFILFFTIKVLSFRYRCPFVRCWWIHKRIIANRVLIFSVLNERLSNMYCIFC